MKRRSHRYEINRLRPRHGHEYNRYIMSLSMMTLTCAKQHLSNIEIQIVKKLSSAEAELKKSIAYKKSCIKLRI